MTGYLVDGSGGQYQLPALLGWTLEYTAGVPCDSFLVRSVYAGEMAEPLRRAVEFIARREGEVVFRGRVDEVQAEWGSRGRTAEISGRGMAALLLDNEALAQEYQNAGLEDILNDHVRPYGIEVARTAALPAVPGFSVAAGSSEWQVLYDFARYYGGVTPRFDRQGRLVAAPWEDGPLRRLEDSAPVIGAVWREKRYGVFSQVLVRDKVRKTVEQVDDPAFLAEGGRCRRVLTMPGRSTYKAMRYSGQFQLACSAAERRRLLVTVAEPFWAWPGELVELAHSGVGLTGTWRVLEARVEQDEDGGRTGLTLGQPDAVLG